MADCERCIHEAEIQSLKNDVERNSATHREFYGKFEEIKVKQGVFDTTLANIVSTLNEIKEDVKSLKEEPAKNYKSIKMCIVTAIISALVTGAVSALIILVK